MRRERTLKIVVVVGLLFSALVYPLLMFVRQEPALAMMLSLYVTLGIVLLLAARNPSAHRSLIGMVELCPGVKAMFTKSLLSAGKHYIKATYPGDSFFYKSPRIVTQVVDPQLGGHSSPSALVQTRAIVGEKSPLHSQQPRGKTSLW